MSADDEEPSVPPEPGKRRRRVCVPGAKCRHCKRKGGDGRTRFTYPDGTLHPYPHRHFVCENSDCPFLVSGVDQRRNIDNAKRLASGLPALPWRWNVNLTPDQILE
jgi:hypothetical protein